MNHEYTYTRMSHSMPDRGDPQAERDAILATLRETIATLATQIEEADPEATAEEELQLKRIHELGYLANQYRKLKRDTDLDEMQSELALLKSAARIEEEE